MNPFLGGAPAALVAELEQRDATIALSWREGARAFARATGQQEDLFARYSDAPADRRRLEHETAVRAHVGDEGALRAPRVLAEGPNWRLEHGVSGTDWSSSDSDSLDGVLAAAQEIPALELPEHPRTAEGGWRLDALIRIARAARGPIDLADLRAARRILADTDLPTVSCHRDFHPKNLLADADGIWVIDWERAAPGPAGLDLMRLWASLPQPEDRERVFEHAVELVGAQHRDSLERLRFSVAVADASGLHTARNPFDRDDVALKRLLELIPALRPRR